MSTGAVINLSFRSWKLASQASFHINGTPFLVNCVKSKAILAKSYTNLRLYPASPKKLHTGVIVVGRSHFVTALTLDLRILRPLSPRILGKRLVVTKIHTLRTWRTTCSLLGWLGLFRGVPGVRSLFFSTLGCHQWARSQKCLDSWTLGSLTPLTQLEHWWGQMTSLRTCSNRPLS